MIPKVLFFEKQPSLVQKAPPKGQQEGEGCFHYTNPTRIQKKKRPTHMGDLHEINTIMKFSFEVRINSNDEKI